MPVLLHEPLEPLGEWGLWEITETENDLLATTPLFAPETAQYAAIKGKARRREFLAARALLHYMSGRGRRGELVKDAGGKPHLKNSRFHVSISHTGGLAAAAAHPAPCGIDVQRIVPRIHRLAHKFVGPAEEVQLLADHALTQLHLIWSAKEAMYKAFGRRGLDFKKHLFVDFGGYDPTKNRATAALNKNDEATMLFDLHLRVFQAFVLVVAVERVDDRQDV